MKKIVAIVPMRHHSERVPQKNYRTFVDKPLYHHIITTLLNCELISQVVIDTDSEFILEDAQKYFPNVLLLNRPAHLRKGEIPMNDVLINTINQVEADFYLQTHSTNPVLSTKSIQQAIKLFLDNYPMYDSLFSVTQLQTRLYNQLGLAINHNPAILLRTQDLPPIFEENSCLYIFTKKILEENHNRIGKRPYLFSLPKHEAVDIDEEIDFKIAEFLFKEYN
ncbi:cytidylyltransferase domain-containing protein [Bernardetia sp.]|uniref:acylneuraminate cytidylyltransferase family protein n=1 Tax=Bernardetia sp. TaxID=1937974 RepID=UPI0025C48C8B|nr:acylneuraminate cytidylyltransferase family protein [Bernardetia sp.]